MIDFIRSLDSEAAHFISVKRWRLPSPYSGEKKHPLFLTVLSLFAQEVLRKNDAGDYFPLLPICLGFELLLKIVSEVNLSENIHTYKTFIENDTLYDKCVPSSPHFCIENDGFNAK